MITPKYKLNDLVVFKVSGGLRQGRIVDAKFIEDKKLWIYICKFGDSAKKELIEDDIIEKLK